MKYPHIFFYVVKFIAFTAILSLGGCGANDSTLSVRSVQSADVTPQSAADNTNPQQQPQNANDAPQTPEPLSEPTIADITDLILITGQSNALGAGTAYDYRLDGGDPRVFAFTEDGWQVATLYQVWDRGWFPRTNPGTEPSNNFSLHFGRRLVERAPDRVVGFVLITAPGQAIEHWRPDGDFFAEIRDKVSNAINELPSKSKFDGILWHQGESDGRDDDYYGQQLYELIANFRSESWFDYGRPFICGETARLPVNEQLRKLNTDNDIWTGCIAAEGLPTRDDDAHFNAESLRLIGNRYADLYYEMTR